MKNFVAFLFFFSFLMIAQLFLPSMSWAQDSTVVVHNGGNSFLADNWGKILAIVLSVYELVVRLYPTVGNYSIISLLMKIISTVIPNNKPTTTTTATTQGLVSLVKPKSVDSLLKHHEVIE